jgi:hypothetical protein
LRLPHEFRVPSDLEEENVSRPASVLTIALVALAGGAGVAEAAPPGVNTGRALAVTQQTATITGSINARGVPTAYYFRVGLTKAYGARTPTTDAGAGTKNRAVSAALSGLKPNATYHYQLVAFSTGGTTRGADRTFRTRQVPTVLSFTATPNPVVYAGLLSFTGSLTGPDVSGKKVALQGKPFPFTGPFQQVGNTVLTSPQGTYGFVVSASITSQFRVVNQSQPSVVSPVVTANVALSTTVRVKRLRRSGRFRFSGRVTPPRVGNAVLIQRRTRRGWATIGITLTRARTAAYSGFVKRLRLKRTDRYRVVVKTSAGDYSDGTSRSRRIRVRRR